MGMLFFGFDRDYFVIEDIYLRLILKKLYRENNKSRKYHINKEGNRYRKTQHNKTRKRESLS